MLNRHRSSEAVPVPAPAPVPETASGYYVRLDAAYSQSNQSKYQATDAFANQVRGDSNLDNFPRFGFGVGYQFSPRFRMDATLDWRSDVTSRGAGTRNYTIANGAGPNPTIDMRDTVSDSITSSTNMTGLLNAYLDAPMSPSFTPYVGVGVGFVRHQLKGRTYSRSTTCVDALDCDPTTVGNQAGSTVDSAAATTAGGTDYSLAAAAMVGFTYKIWDSTKLDLGYRFLYLQGTNFVGRNAAVVENLKIPDQNIHEMRVGVRYDIN
ncbi:unnamed protein product [Phaeothamnion confervicola]